MDIVIASLICAITVRMGYAGVQTTLHPVAKNDDKRKKRIEIEFVVLAVLSCLGWQAYRSTQASSELTSLIKKNQNPLVGLSTLRLEPRAQVLTPSMPLLIGMAISVAGVDEAKAMRCNFDAFALPGPEGRDQNRDAIDKFRLEVASSQATGEDKLPGKFCYKGLLVRLGDPEINEVVAGNRIIYAMGYAAWKNQSGADFHTDICKWMETPKSRLVSNPGWHDCAP